MDHALAAISSIPASMIALYSSTIIFIIIFGRFFWVYLIAYLPQWLSPGLRKRDPSPPWQYPFIVSWAGMRGGISLAAALAVPALADVDGINPKDLLVFLVFTSIIATLLIQGLSLPWLIKILGVHEHGIREKNAEHQTELLTRLEMCKAVLTWLTDYEVQVKDDTNLANELHLQIKVHESMREQLKRHLEYHDTHVELGVSTIPIEAMHLVLANIIEVERRQLEQCWQDNKISHAIKSKLEKQLDLRAKHIEELG